MMEGGPYLLAKGIIGGLPLTSLPKWSAFIQLEGCHLPLCQSGLHMEGGPYLLAKGIE